MWDVDNQYPSIAWDYYYEEPAGGVTYPDRIGRSLGPFNEGIWSGNIMSDPDMRVEFGGGFKCQWVQHIDHASFAGRRWAMAYGNPMVR